MMAETPQGPFEAPGDPDVSIWRYIDFTKFVAMLDSRALWFSRADCLGDTFEGSTPEAEADYWARMRAAGPEQSKVADHNERVLRDMARLSRSRTYVNCWHMNEHESAAMWQLYSREAASIAVRSSFARLRAVLPAEVDLGIVKYIDYQAEIVPFGNIISYCMHKRKSFEHERELRALIWTMGLDNKTHEPKWPMAEGAVGTAVNVDLSQLVTELFVSPLSPPWFEALVRRVVERYQLTLTVRRSALEREPLL